MRYSKPLLQLPGSVMAVEKGFPWAMACLSCPNGGNVIRRHNEIRDVTQDNCPRWFMDT